MNPESTQPSNSSKTQWPEESNPQPYQEKPKRKKISLNPLVHFINAYKHMTTQNKIDVLALSLAGNVIAYLVLLLIPSSLDSDTSSIDSFATDFTGSTLIKIGLAALLAFLVTVVLQVAVSRILVKNRSQNPESMGDSMQFALSRLGTVVVTNLLIAVGIIALVAVVVALIALSPLLGVVITLVATVMALVVAIRLSLISLVLADDPPQGAIASIKASYRLSKPGDRAILIAVLFIGILVISSAIFESSMFPDTTRGTGLIVDTFMNTFFAFFSSVLLSNVYYELKELNSNASSTNAQ